MPLAEGSLTGQEKVLHVKPLGGELGPQSSLCLQGGEKEHHAALTAPLGEAGVPGATSGKWSSRHYCAQTQPCCSRGMQSSASAVGGQGLPGQWWAGRSHLQWQVVGSSAPAWRFPVRLHLKALTFVSHVRGWSRGHVQSGTPLLVPLCVVAGAVSQEELTLEQVG